MTSPTEPRDAIGLSRAHADTSDKTLEKKGFGDALDLAFLATALLSTLANQLAPGHLAVASKLLPMGLLLARLGLARRDGRVDRRMAGLLLAGFVASTVGDLVIAYVFVGGIAAFLVAHLFYLVAMGRPRGALASHALAALPALGFGVAMAAILVGGHRVPEPLLVPVSVYITVICSMLARALGRAFVDARTQASRFLALGAATFVLSDSLIALSRWVITVPYPRIAVLATYYLAQRLVLEGAEPMRAAETVRSPR